MKTQEAIQLFVTNLGEIRLGQDIGKEAHAKYIWHACIICGKERWVRFLKGKPETARCFHCGLKARKLSGKNNPRWGGGRKQVDKGYIKVYLYPDDFFLPMACKDNYVREHRLVMAKHLGRCLQPWELVHHKNHIRDDNRIENLQLVSDDRHNQITILENKIGYLQNRITLLEAEIVLLHQQNEERQNPPDNSKVSILHYAPKISRGHDNENDGGNTRVRD